jgi:hypothetical protein
MSMHATKVGPSFFFVFLGTVSLLDFCCCQCVPMKVPLCSHQVPNNFSLFNPISFALSFTLVTYRTSPKREFTMYFVGGLFKI